MYAMKHKIIQLFCLLLVISCQNNDIEVFNGKDSNISKMNGNWVVVNYWADWCAPCIKEIPEIAAFSKKYPEVEVFAFNFDRLEAEDLRPQIKKFGITYPSLVTHPRSLWGIQTPKTLPATYFISPDGDIVFTSLKPQDEASLSLIYKDLQNGV